MKSLRATVLVFAACWGAHAASASPAKFWLSTSPVDPDGVESPQLVGVENSTRYLYIWGQPGTVDPNLPFNATSNRFKTIQDLSLNLMSEVHPDGSTPLVDFVDGTYTIYNPVLNNKPRFIYTADSHAAADDGPLTSEVASLQHYSPPTAPNGYSSLDNDPDKQFACDSDCAEVVRGLGGYGGFPVGTGNGNGIGHPSPISDGCFANDPYCALTHDAQQSPAWLIGSVGVKMTSATGNANLFLQIGANGITYASPAEQASEVVFGLNSPAPGYSYHSTVFNERQLTLDSESPDATITGLAAANVPLSTWSGGTGSWGQSSWTGGVPSYARNAKLPASAGTYIVTVTGKQAANDTTVGGGTLNISNGAFLASSVTVAAGGSISGQGWIGSDLTMQPSATLTIDSSTPLQVVGTANVAGAKLRLGSNFAGGAGVPIEILRTQGGVLGSFATAHNESLGGGMFVNSVVKSADGNSLILTLSGVAGDYNGNNVVDAGDYVVWRKFKGCSTTTCLAADGDHNGIVDDGDYTVWRSHYGRTGGSGSGVAVVAEPNSLLILLALPGMPHFLLRRSLLRCSK